jgi:DNA invertase Pin-like site-specific DNA recombinase
MVYVIYNRVSSIGQNKYNKGVSLNVQEEICHKYASEHKIQCRSIYKEINSAYNKLPPVLNGISNKKNYNIIISSIDRYSRSLTLGLALANKIITNGGSLTFVQENIICKTVEDINQLKSHLQVSENESSLISTRIKKSMTYLKNNGMFAGGYIPYGYEVIDRKLVKLTYEQLVLKFIKCCRHAPISGDSLNTNMKNISQLTKFVPINCYDGDNLEIKSIRQSLHFTEIAELLNDYNCTKRGRKWKSYTVISAAFPKNSKISNQFNNWGEIKKELSDAENSSEMSPEELINQSSDNSSDEEEYKIQNMDLCPINVENNLHNPDNDYEILPVRSNESKVNDPFKFDFKQRAGNPFGKVDKKLTRIRKTRSTKPFYSRELYKSKKSKNDSDSRMTNNDYKLFQQFKEFQKFQKNMK